MVFLELEKLPSAELGATIITVGNFDGVHVGHQQLIKNTVTDARAKGLKSVVVTFFPHPASYFQPDRVPPIICSKRYKEFLIKRFHVDAILTLQFNAKLAALEAEDYVKQILLEKLQMKAIWIGYDFTFGRNRRGNARLLLELGEKYNFHANVLNPQCISETVVSSTKIRELILAGDVQKASILLNRIHVISGFVVTGDSRGREISFPTVNLNIDEGLIPAPGIYSGVAHTGSKEYPAAIYIGSRPTCQNSEFRIEAHLIGFTGNLYGERVSLAFLKFKRPDQKFNSLEELAKVIKLDCDDSLKDFHDFKTQKSHLPIIWD